MPSPFPGMDPYLEHPDWWPGLHNRLIAALDQDLSARLPPPYYVHVDERVYIDLPRNADMIGRPDVLVARPRVPVPSNGSRGATGTSSSGRGQLLTVELPVPDQIRESYLEVRKTSTQEVISTLEVLSPSNKRPGEGRRAYEDKRLRTLGTRTHLVEIDLLRAWDPFPMWLADRPDTNALPGDYRIVVARGDLRPWADLYVFTIREAIPPFPLPLQPGDDALPVDLQSLFAAVYDRGRYGEQVDYRAEPVPPLRPEDASWADAVLREKGAR